MSGALSGERVHIEMEVESEQIKTSVPDEYADKVLPSQPPIGRLDLLIGPERQVLGCFQETQHRTPSPAPEFIDYWRVGCAAWLQSSCLTRASRRALRALQPRRLLVSRRNSSSILYVIRCASAVALRCCSGRGLLAARRRTA